ncbi:chorismate mutase [Spizellomyces punctatus DAOM BR117]|uniref:Chorismate mutase n=1 Tax=Spizellomyces punctatus (strain DAOM BR117) TaxID=645134 RepID=A0A0L0HMZ7_SPIPD|nr:chorismate mutase [Spizellomyces punctatus DAOM BR117]KND02300.1 chorismate mutase [Spizellomyces punctatus DAOM BR117]|eukprot:XP_016610339.1 chorismate mutase [Spizellomyces punctatus DAOM BR117]
MNFFDSELSLPKIRDELVRLEDSIIFAMIERAQFAQNTNIYKKGHFKVDGFNGSFLEYLLQEIEGVHAKVRRYTSPDEYPFSKNLPDPILPPLQYPQVLAPNNINYNEKLMHIYINNIVPIICKPGDDSNYGSAATKDVEALQILSRRIHFGKFVAEAKFKDAKDHDQYVSLIKARDREGIMQLLTNHAVEEKLLRRLRRKALVYGQEIDDDAGDATSGQQTKGQGQPRIPHDVVADMYEKYVIPLTKEVEVEYLLHRLDYGNFQTKGLTRNGTQ